MNPARRDDPAVPHGRSRTHWRTRVVEDAIRTVHEHALPINLTRYVLATGSPDLFAREIEFAARDGRFDGFDVYESAHLTMIEADGQVLPRRDWTDAIGRAFANARRLRDH